MVLNFFDKNPIFFDNNHCQNEKEVLQCNCQISYDCFEQQEEKMTVYKL